jgi:nitroreductase
MANIAFVRKLSVTEAIYKRRAVRSYSGEVLSEQTIRTLLAAAVQAPTAMHLEPWSFVIIQDKAALKRYSDRAKAMLPRGDGVPPALLEDPLFNIFYDAGTLMVICAEASSPHAQADAWLAAENVMLSACAMALGTCCIGVAVPLFNSDAVKVELGIPRDVVAVAPIIVGVPREATPPVPRRDPLILSWVK